MISKSKEATQMPYSPLNTLSADNTREITFSEIPVFTENINMFPSQTQTHPKTSNTKFQDSPTI